MRRRLLVLLPLAAVALAAAPSAASVYCVYHEDDYVRNHRLPTAFQVCVPGP